MKLIFALVLLGLAFAFVSSKVIDDTSSSNGQLIIDGEPISEDDIEVYGLHWKDVKELAKKFAHLIKAGGAKAWDFIKCMGVDWAKHCAPATLKCATVKDLAGCLGLIVCEGKDAKECSAVFHKNSTL